jgi:hypothetical protein
MQENCILCGKAVERGGYAAKIEGFAVRPVCPECDGLCTRQPKQVVEEHRDFFKRLLAERVESISREMDLGPTLKVTPQESRGDWSQGSVPMRYGFLRFASGLIMFLGVLISVLSIVIGLISLTGVVALGVSPLLVIVPAVVICIHGVLIAAGGQLLTVFVDISDSLFKIEQNSRSVQQRLDSTKTPATLAA